MNYHEDRIRRVKEAVAQFPKIFGLRGWPGRTFRVSVDSSYVNDNNVVMLYTQSLFEGKWLDFAKGTESELRNEIVSLPPLSKEKKS